MLRDLKARVYTYGFDTEEAERLNRCFAELQVPAPLEITPSQADVVLEDIILHGKEATSKTQLGLCNIGGTLIELVNPVEGENLYQEFLDAGHEGIHHVGEYVEDLDVELKYFTERGIKVVQSGKTVGIRNAYLDLRDEIGLIWELIEMKPRKPRRKKKKNKPATE